MGGNRVFYSKPNCTLLPISVRYSFLVFALLFMAPRLSAQEGSAGVDSLAGTGISAYQAIMGYTSRLYNGPEYIRTYRNAAGTPFLVSDSLLPGTVTYDGVTYRNVFLNYDLVQDDVVVKGMQAFSLRLVREKVDSFTLGGRRFLYLARNNGFALPDGFYEVLYRGKVLVLARRVKRYIVSIRTDEPSRFVFSSRFYILHNGTVRSIENRSDLLNAFPERKDAVRKHLQGARLDFKKEPERTLMQAVTFNEQTAS
jgi:hypothetical protein